MLVLSSFSLIDYVFFAKVCYVVRRSMDLGRVPISAYGVLVFFCHIMFLVMF